MTALIRDQQMLANPKSSTVFQADDLVGLIGEGEDVAAAERLIGGERELRGAGTGPAPVGRAGEAEAHI